NAREREQTPKELKRVDNWKSRQRPPRPGLCFAVQDSRVAMKKEPRLSLARCDGDLRLAHHAKPTQGAPTKSARAHNEKCAQSRRHVATTNELAWSRRGRRTRSSDF